MSGPALASQGALKSLTGKMEGRTPGQTNNSLCNFATQLQISVSISASNFFFGFVVRIHFLDNSSKIFLASEDTTAKDIVLMVLEKYDVQDAERTSVYFSLFESKNGNTIDEAISLEAKVVECIDGWAKSGVDKTAKFLFMIRLYMPSVWGLQYRDLVAAEHGLSNKASLATEDYIKAARTVDGNCLTLQFIQAVYHIITGRYPTTVEQALELGALHFLQKFGSFRPDNHKPGFLGNRIVEFIPTKHLKAKPSKQETVLTVKQWEAKLLEKVESIATGVSSHAQHDSKESDNYHEDGTASSFGAECVQVERKYMDIVYLMDCYGSSLFRCTQKCTRLLPDNIFVGICHQGVKIFDKQRQFVSEFRIEDIFRWGYKPAVMFYFEINGEEHKLAPTGESHEDGVLPNSLDFETNEGKVISDLLTDYAMAFLRERSAEDERANMRTTILSNQITTNIPGVQAGVPSPKNKELTLKLAQSATKIQSVFRGFSLRSEWAKEDSAILIQSIVRSYLARIRLSKMIEQMIKSGEL